MEFFSPILDGILRGLLLATLVGPVFFSLLEISIKSGFRAGFFLSLGIMLSDISWLLASYLGLAKLFSQGTYNDYLGYGGGVLLFVFGVSNLVKKSSTNSSKSLENLRTDGMKLMLKGYFLNLITPFVPVFWFAFTTNIIGLGYTKGQQWLLITGMIITVLGTDLLKSWFASKLRRFLSANRLIWMNRISGVILIAFAIRLVWVTVQ